MRFVFISTGFQVLQFHREDGEVELLYPKEEAAGLFSQTNERSWEDTDVILGVLPQPTLDISRRRKVLYKFS